MKGTVVKVRLSHFRTVAECSGQTSGFPAMKNVAATLFPAHWSGACHGIARGGHREPQLRQDHAEGEELRRREVLGIGGPAGAHLGTSGALKALDRCAGVAAGASSGWMRDWDAALQKNPKGIDKGLTNDPTSQGLSWGSCGPTPRHLGWTMPQMTMVNNKLFSNLVQDYNCNIQCCITFSYIICANTHARIQI